MGSTWKLQDAKNQFSEVVKQASRSGPQIVTRHGEETAVILSIEDYRRLTRPEVDLVQFLQDSPLCGEELEFDRSTELSREIEL